MNDLNRQQMFLALIGLVMALFVMSGLPGRWRRQLRMAAIVVFIVAVAIALVEIALCSALPAADYNCKRPAVPLSLCKRYRFEKMLVMVRLHLIPVGIKE